MSGGTPLCAEERETISRELSRENSARGIAKLLGRHHSTIAREINVMAVPPLIGLLRRRSVTSHSRYGRRSTSWWPRPGFKTR